MNIRRNDSKRKKFESLVQTEQHTNTHKLPHINTTHIAMCSSAPIPNFVYAVLQKKELHCQKQKLKQVVRRKERSMKSVESPIVRHRIQKEIATVETKIHKIEGQINLYK